MDQTSTGPRSSTARSSTTQAAPVRRCARAIEQRIGDELILLDPDTEDFIALNSVGARIWDLLAVERTSSALAEAVAAEWGIRVDTAAADVDQFLGELAAIGLLDDGDPGSDPIG